ncbi:hypothetical protein ACEWPL_019245 [Roseovarius sp. S1116L3]|uniref:hypothetical protein n=1 Tax=Roseovarius roseus TaxID=3342636 RepID=UPI0037268137
MPVSRNCDNEIDLGYTLALTRASGGYGLFKKGDWKLVDGANFRCSKELSTISEHNWGLFGGRRVMARTYGVNYTPIAY